MSAWAESDGGAGRPAGDPYRTLGVAAGASDVELRRAYHRLAKLHHPDRNGGSAEAAKRFTEVQSAYRELVAQRRHQLELEREPGGSHGRAPAPESGGSDARAPAPEQAPSPRQAWAEPWLEQRIVAIERQYAEYAARRLPQDGVRESDAGEPPAPAPAETLRERLTDWFREA